MSDLVNEMRQGSLNKDDYRWRAATRIAQLEAEGDKARARGDRMRMALEDIAYGNPLYNKDDLMRIARTILEEPK